ncbi:MAG: hypothetical protein LBI57_02475 [Helicobacteraceae bacterium]|jgi:hypothetical protein|nr:hypothetical protein [Helicobacteraceae bacterium]
MSVLGQVLRLSHIDPRIKSDRDICIAHFENDSNSWYLTNEAVDDLALLSNNIKTKIAINNKIKPIDEQKLLLSKQGGGKIAIVRFI